MKKINFLPTKIKYNSYSKNIEMFYRKKNSNNLFKTKVPYDHYIFVDSSYRTYGEIDTTYTLLGTNNELIKIYIDPSDAREIYNMGRYITAEGDVSPEQRFACDSFYNVEFPKDINPRIFLLDIEAYVVDSLMPSFSHNIAPINAITIYDTYTKKYYCWFCPKEKVDIIEEEKKIRELYSKYDDTEIEINIFLNYKDLLNSFMIFMSKNTPDIISAWNSKFDLPYIARKIFDEFGLDGLKFISPFNTVSFSLRKALDDNLDFEYDNVFPGIDVIDMLEMYKKHTPGDRPSFSLKAISEEELDESKLIFEEESSDPAEMYEKDFTFFCMYNIQDVRLVKMLEDKRKLLNLAAIIRNIAKINYKDVFFESIIIDNLFLMEAYKRREHDNWNYALPSKVKNTQKIKYLGGFCKPPLVGRYKWVADLDYTALYPSIDRTFNMSIETVVGKVSENYQEIFLYFLSDFYNIDNYKFIFEKLLPSYLEYHAGLIEKVNSLNAEIVKENKQNIKIKINYEKLYKSDNNADEFIGIKSFVNWLKENNYAFLPNGVIFDQNIKDALVPKVFTVVSASRNNYKAIMKKYIAEGNKELSELYDVYQVAVKVVNNAIYGVLASERFRLFNIHIAEGITASGQLVIKNSQNILNNYINNLVDTKNVDYVLAIDTDSLIFTLNKIVDYPVETRDEKILNEIANHSKECQTHINNTLPDFVKKVFNKHKANDKNNFLSIKNEWLGSSGMFIAKKAYAINLVFKEGFPHNKTRCVGITLIKSSTPKKLKTFLVDVLNKMLLFSDKSEIDKMISDECDKLKNVYELDDIALPISINNINSYTKNLPVHVRGSRLWNDYFAKNEMEKIISEKVKYIYVEKWQNNELNNRKEYVLAVPNKKEYWDRVKNEITVDYNKMKDRLIVKQLERFYNAMGWKMSNSITTNSNGAFNVLLTKNKSIKKINLL